MRTIYPIETQEDQNIYPMWNFRSI